MALPPTGAPATGATTGASTPPHPYRWAMMFGVWLLYYTFGLTMASLAPLVGVIEADLGINHIGMGTILGAWPVVYIAASAPCGMLLDRFGPRRMLFCATLVIAFSFVLRGVSQGYFGLLLAIMVFGIGGPLVSAGAPKVISLWFTDRDRGLAIGIYFTGNAVGGITALSLTNSVMMPAFDGDWRRVMMCYAGFVLIGGIVWLLINLHPAAESMERTLAAEAKAPFMQVFMELIRLPVVRLILTMGIFILFFNHGFNNWLPSILQERGFSLIEAGYWASIPTAFGMISALILPRLATRDRRDKILFGLFLSAASATFLIYAATGPLLLGGLVMQGMCRGAMTSISILMLMDLDDGDTRRVGAASGLYFSAAEVGGALGPMSMGILAQATGSFTVPIFMMTGVTVILMLLLARLRVLTHRRG